MLVPSFSYYMRAIIRPMQRIIDAHGLLHYCYTNDIGLQFYFLISEWMASNRLKLNPSKSEFLLAHSHPASPSTWLQYLRTWWYWSPTSWHHRNLGVHFGSCIDIWRFIRVSSFEAVSINCVGLNPFANSFRAQPPSSWSTSSLSPGLTTTSAYWRVYRRVR